MVKAIDNPSYQAGRDINTLAINPDAVIESDEESDEEEVEEEKKAEEDKEDEDALPDLLEEAENCELNIAAAESLIAEIAKTPITTHAIDRLSCVAHKVV